MLKSEFGEHALHGCAMSDEPKLIVQPNGRKLLSKFRRALHTLHRITVDRQHARTEIIGQLMSSVLHKLFCEYLALSPG